MLREVQRVPLPGVKGGFDLIAFDAVRGRLLLNAEDNGTTEVVDLNGMGSYLRSITGMHEPKWVAYRPELGKVFVANGDGSVRVLRSSDYAAVGRIELGLPANNLRYDAPSTSLLVGLGDRSGAIAVVDARRDRVTRRIALDALPKQFEIDGDRLYVNIPDKRLVQVVDWKTGRTLARWPACDSANVPMALDRSAHRLFVGCEGGRMVVLDTRTGRTVTAASISSGADGIYLDPVQRLIYVSAADGFVDVLGTDGGDRLRLVQRIATRRGAGTSLFVPSTHRLIVALPQQASAPAEIRSYATP